MANVINTRIQLKYDTLSNWNTSTFKPLKGEVCIAKVDVTQPENSLLQPIMFKVGDGDHTFAELGWTSAKAADVYAWAKAAELPVDDTLATEGKFVVGFDWEGDKLIPKFRDFVTEINDTNKDKLDAPTTKAVKTYVDGKIADVVAQGTVVAAGDGIDVVQSGNTYTVSHENTSDVANVTAAARTYITGLTFDEFGHVTGTTVGTEEDQDLSNYKTKQAVVEETGAANQTLKISQNENGVITTEAVDIAITSAQVTGLGSAAFTDSTAYATAAQGTKADNAAPQATTYNKTEVDGLVKTAKDAADAAQGTANEAKTKIDTFLGTITPDGSADIIDTLAEINTNINENTDAFTGLSTRVTNIENGTTTVGKATEAANYSAGGTIDTDIKAAAKAGTDAAKAVEDGVKDGTIKAAKATDAETLGGVAPSGYKTKQTAVADPAANGQTEAFISSITQNENGEIVATKKNLPSFYFSEEDGALNFGSQQIILESEKLSFEYGNSVDTSGKYLKINLGTIVKDDLSTEIQTSLGKADTAIQADDLHAVATSGSIYDLEEVHTTADATIAGGNYLVFSCGSASVNI